MTLTRSDKDELFNQLRIIIAHGRTFGPRLRWHAFQVAKQVMMLSKKQIARLSCCFNELHKRGGEASETDESVDGEDLLSFENWESD
mgnify:FL=1